MPRKRGKRRTFQHPGTAEIVIEADGNGEVEKRNQRLNWNAPAAITYGSVLSAVQLCATLLEGDGALTYDPPEGTLLNAGVHTLKVTAAETDGYRQAVKEVSLQVNKAAQDLVWADPAAIIYGTALGAAQLDAKLTKGDGALTYDPAPGTVLNAGGHTLKVIAAETANYKQTVHQAKLRVDKAEQEIAWDTPAGITYGTALGAAQLGARLVKGNGALTYQPASGIKLNAGDHLLKVMAAETANYKPVTKEVSLQVAKAQQRIEWVDPGEIVYGTALGTAQLNAQLTAGNGQLTYAPGKDAILKAGTHVLKATASETPNYRQTTKEVTLRVRKAEQRIDWEPPTAIVYGVPLDDVQLNAVVSEGDGALTYEPAAGTVLNAGDCMLKVTAAETADYLPCSKTVPLTVLKAERQITWKALAPQMHDASIPISARVDSPQADPPGPIQVFVRSQNGDQQIAPTAVPPHPGAYTLVAKAAETANAKAAEASVRIIVYPTIRQWFEKWEFIHRGNKYMKTISEKVDGKALHLTIFTAHLPAQSAYWTADEVLDNLLPSGDPTGFHITMEYWPLGQGLKNPHVFRGSDELYVGQGIPWSSAEKVTLGKRLHRILNKHFKTIRSSTVGSVMVKPE